MKIDVRSLTAVDSQGVSGVGRQIEGIADWERAQVVSVDRVKVESLIAESGKDTMLANGVWPVRQDWAKIVEWNSKWISRLLKGNCTDAGAGDRQFSQLRGDGGIDCARQRSGGARRLCSRVAAEERGSGGGGRGWKFPPRLQQGRPIYLPVGNDARPAD